MELIKFLEYWKEEVIDHFNENGEVLEDVLFDKLHKICKGDTKLEIDFLNYLLDNNIIEYGSSTEPYISPFYSGFKLKFRLSKIYLRKRKLKKL